MKQWVVPLLLLLVLVTASDEVPCWACLEGRAEAGLLSCVQLSRRRMAADVAERMCGRLHAGDQTTCEDLGMCPRSRKEADEHIGRMIGVHGKGAPSVQFGDRKEGHQ